MTNDHKAKWHVVISEAASDTHVHYMAQRLLIMLEPKLSEAVGRC